MQSILNTHLAERIIFALLVIGILLTAYAVIGVIDTSTKLSNNPAQQFRETGEQLEIQSTAEGRGLMAADLERRDLSRQRGEFIALGGAGLVVLGLAWYGSKLRNHYANPASSTDPLTET